jgi:hypothetical protein
LDLPPCPPEEAPAGGVAPCSRSPLPAKPDRRKIRVAALQLELKLFKNPLDYADAMHQHVHKAAVEGAQIVVFPEYNNLPLLGLLPGIEKMEESYQNQEENSNQDRCCRQ